jgi:hypothetical protein
MTLTLRSGTGDQGDRVEQLFEQALELPDADRERFIATECGDDTALAAELLSLLGHAMAGERFFGRLAMS